MCNGGTSKSKSAEALRLSTVRSVSASGIIATRTWDNGRLPSFAPLEEIIWRRVETKIMPLGRTRGEGSPSERFSIAIVVNPQYLIVSLLKTSPTAGTVVVSAQ